MKFVKKLIELYHNNSLRAWPVFETEETLTQKDCKEIKKHIKEQASISPEVNFWNSDRIQCLYQQTKLRKRWYETTSTLWKYSFFFGVLFLVTSVLQKSQLIFFLASTVLVISSFSLMASLSIGRNKTTHILSDFLSHDLTSPKRDLVAQIIHELIAKPSELFIAANYNKLRKIPHEVFDAENAFLLLTESERFRDGIMLTEGIPLGAVFIRPQTLSAEKEHEPNVKEAQLPHNRNKRDFQLQSKYLSSIKSLKITVAKLHAKFPTDPLTEMRPITKERQARLDALEYVTTQAGYWENRNAKPPSRESAKHKDEIRKIFSPIARSNSTLNSGKLGIDLTNSFLKLKDRTLETWLNEAFDE